MPSRDKRRSVTKTLSKYTRKSKVNNYADIIVQLSENFFSADPASTLAVCQRTN